MKVFYFCLTLMFFIGCAATENSNLNSTLWMQTAAEYQANSIQTYHAALANIPRALNDKSWTAALEQSTDFESLPPAVVFDVDETVLDNSAYEAHLLKTNTTYSSESWNQWISMKAANAVPGAVDFINKIQEMGITPIYITNRACLSSATADNTCQQEYDTIENLKKVGINNVSKENLLLKNEQKGWTSEKKSRREYLASRYRIIMLFGDDLGDFLPDAKSNITCAQRSELVNTHVDKWGTKWFVLSNPTYGSWYNILNNPKEQYLRGY